MDEEGGYTWDAERREYTDADGNVVDAEEVRGALDAYVEQQTGQSDRMAKRLADGQSTLETWQGRMRRLITVTIGAGFLAGIGGRRQVDDAAKATLGQTIAGQFQWLDGFARDLSQGQLTKPMLLARAAQYITAARTAFERGRASTFDDLDLPAEPGFGCACGARCRCHWDINEYEDRWECFWIAENDPSTCGDCGDRSSDYSPYTQRKAVAA